MFIWDFVADKILGQIVDWFYSQVVGFLGNFFSEMGSMGAELFEMSWVQSVVLFFSYLGWALFATGLVVAVFECGIEYSAGRGNVKETALNVLKGFLAVSLFTQVPVRLYSLAISLQGTLTAGITGFGSTSIGDVAKAALADLENLESLTESTYPLRGFGRETSGLMVLFCLILMAYAVIKVFFSNLKRGGILLIQIAVGSLYMFSVPRGYGDGFVQWCKQVIGLAGHHPCGRADGIQRSRPAGLGTHALCRGNSPYCRGLWAGHHHEGQSYLGGLHSSERRQYCPDGGGQMRCITMGSLFDGIGGFPLAAIHNGVIPLWVSEIEPFPIRVTQQRLPGMLHYGDITKLDGAMLPPVDIICGGSPCQDLSVAGARAGLAGERSGLIMEQIRIVKEMRDADRSRGRAGIHIRPRFMVWENVPYALQHIRHIMNRNQLCIAPP